MYLLDTNVVSELRKVRSGKADQHVTAWFAGRPLSSLYLSVIRIMELRLGVVRHLRSDPSQAMVYQAWLEHVLQMGFGPHILPVDLAVATRCGELQGPDPHPFRDALIAATAHVHGLTVVTRDVKDFGRMDIPLVNPWD